MNSADAASPQIVFHELTQEQNDWLSNAPTMPELLRLHRQGGGVIEYVILERDQGGRVSAVRNRTGHKGFVLKVQDRETLAQYAAKVCVPADYDDVRTEFVECKLSTKLRGSGELFVIPFAVGRVDRFPGMPGPQDQFVCFVSEWVDGETVESVANGDACDLVLDPQFMCTVIQETFRAVHFLKTKGLKHDDLHAGNIMVRKKDPGLILSDADAQTRTVSVIDMGSLKPADQATKKSKDDDLYLVSLIVELYNAAWKNRSLAAEHPVFLAHLARLARELSDEDHSRYYADDESIMRAIDGLRKVIGLPRVEPDAPAIHPFEAISAEHLTDDTVLLRLFVDTLPWFLQAFAPKPLVLTGPRGCGKSMLFRYMAAMTHVAAGSETGAFEPRYLGVYISCATHLQNSLMWLARVEGRVNKNSEAIVTFFNLVVAREFFRALQNAHDNAAASRAFGLNDVGIDQLIEYAKTLFEVTVETPRLSTKPRAAHFADDLDRLRVKLQADLLHGRVASVLLSQTFLADLTSHLPQCLPKLARAGVVFLLDDYSSTRVHQEIQLLLNKVIFERRATHYFKISCEKFSFNGRDVDLVRIDETREYETIDAGDQAVFEMTDPIRKDFIGCLINRRLVTAGWKGRVETLIGDSGDFANDVKLAKYIREQASQTGKRYFYRGLDHLSRLWSGDIATILQVIRDMFMRANVGPATEARISDSIQHESIVQVSKAFRERVAGHYPYGPEMARILNAFGSMASEILRNGSVTSDGHPRRLYRIEMTKDQQLPLITLLEQTDVQVAALARELLRRAVFVQYSDSRGKEGVGTQTARWELRKIFLPSFGLSLTRNSYIDVKSLKEFVSLFVEPTQFASVQTAKYRASSNESLF